MADDPSNPEHPSRSSASSLSEPSKGASTRRGVIYEIFILGELMGGPHHGYLLREILSRIVGPFQQMSWGALYPLIRRLQQQGLIKEQTAGDAACDVSIGRSRQRIVYDITDLGRAHFLTLLLQPRAFSPDYRDLFMVKLNYFGSITVAQQLALLSHYRSYVQLEAEHLRVGKERIDAARSIPANERPHIERLMRFRWNSVEAQLAWIDDEVARLEREAEQ